MLTQLFKNNHSRQITLAVFIAAFLIWGYLFRGFLTSELSLVGDAQSYYEHFNYFVENVSRGVYPFWEPTRDEGVPTEFFMRRIGEFNPLYIVLFVLNAIFSYKTAHLFFLAFYYFFGIVGFYKLILEVTQDRISSLSASLILLFSSFSTLIFGSFMVILFTPFIWFFYHWFSFSHHQRRIDFLGMIFYLMIIASTYIPFYFLTIVGAFMVFYGLLFPVNLAHHLQNYGRYVMSNKLSVLLCVLCLAGALWPGLSMVTNTKEADIILPTRSFNAQTESMWGVAQQRVDFGGLIPYLIPQELFVNLKDMWVSRVYVPFYAHILFLLGILVCIRRTTLLVFFWLFIIYLISMYDSRVYQWFYTHVFFFKYFRNFQFFFWIVILPLYIVLGALHLKEFLGGTNKATAGRLGGLVGIHAVFMFYLIRQEGLLWSSVLFVILSLLFFVFLELRHRAFGEKLFKKEQVQAVFIVVLCLLPTWQVYTYLGKSAVTFKEKHPWGDYRYQGKYPYHELILPDFDMAHNQPVVTTNEELVQPKDIHNIYMGTKAYIALYKNINTDILDRYIKRGKLVAYDRVLWASDEAIDVEQLALALKESKNLAYISSPGEKASTQLLSEQFPGQSTVILKASPEVNVKKFDVNRVVLETNFASDKFLVYNDAFYPSWQAWLDGKPREIHRANVAFKGVFVPAGKHVLEMRVYSSYMLLQKCFYFILFYGFFGVYIYFILRVRR